MRTIMTMMMLTVVLISCSAGRLERSGGAVLPTSVRSETLPDPQITGIDTMLTVAAFNMFKTVCAGSKNDNLCFSPVSLSSAMAMVYAGAKNNTATQIAKALGFNPDKAAFYSDFSTYYADIQALTRDSSMQFRLANRTYFDKMFTLLPQFKDVVANYFHGAVVPADFRGNAALSEQEINDFVAGITQGRIADILSKGSLNADTKMVLVNAVYVNAAWKHIFKKEATQKRDFNVMEGSKVSTDFMRRKFTGMQYAHVGGLQMIEMPYTTPGLSFMVLLPDGSDAQNLADKFPDSRTYYALCDSLSARSVYVEMPKFKVESQFGLVPAMRAAGVTDAFKNADFSDMTNVKGLSISDIVQKVFFRVDEAGTEAAAATAVSMTVTALYPPIKPEEFIADHPFFYILKENTHNTPLFIGRFVKP